MLYLPRQMRRLVTLVGLGFLLSLPLTSIASDLLPVIPKGKGDQCVEQTDVMRKNHMDYILHQRDETMHRGIRTSKHSLKECIECHNAPGNDGKVVRVSSDKHFCSSCHTYSAVKIDCFECHADKPVDTQYRHTAGSNGGSH